MRKIRIFVSFAKPDSMVRKSLGMIIEALPLEEVKLDILAYDRNRAGPWREQVLRYIERSHVVVFLLSAAFDSSEYCSWELARVLDRGDLVKIVPVLIEEFSPNPSISSIIDNLHFPLSRKPVKGERNKRRALMEIAEFIGREAVGIAKLSSSRHIFEESCLILRNAIESGLFTPVLGPGCHSLREQHEAVKEFLERRLRWLLGHNLKPSEQIYLRSVVAANMQDIELSSLDGEKCPESSWRLDLLAVQAGLVRIGAEASRIFKSGMQSLAGINTIEVSIGEKDRKGSYLRGLLIEVSTLVGCMESRWNSEAIEIGLGIRGMRQQLVWLTWAIFSQDFFDAHDLDAKTERWCDDHPYEQLPVRPRVRPPQLEFWYLEWLADLLWHTLRVDAPIYPSPKDLAFHFSLSVRQSSAPRRVTIEAAALTAEEEERRVLTLSALKGYMSRRPLSSSEPSSFFRSLARAVQYKFNSAPANEGISSNGPAWSAALVERGRDPRIVINANFDMEIEREFRSLYGCFGVLFPVYVRYTTRDGPDRQADWLLVIETEGASRLEWMLWETEFEGNILQVLSDRLPGPLVVKINGSPLQPLPEKMEDVSSARCLRESGARVAEVCHRLILSELDALRYSIPKGLQSVLAEKNRSVCFVGCPTADLARRLEVHHFIEGGEEFNAHRKLLVVGSSRDTGHRAVLDLARTELLSIDINRLAEIVHDVANGS